MTVATLVTGALLTLAGIAGYTLSDSASLTALIPTVVGVLLLVCGLVARKEHLRRHAIHAGLAIAALGALGSLMNATRIGAVLAGTAERPAAVILSTLMFVLLVAYLVLGIRSFVRARRFKAAGS